MGGWILGAREQGGSAIPVPSFVLAIDGEGEFATGLRVDEALIKSGLSFPEDKLEFFHDTGSEKAG
jgi:hypothetical protein